jgi:Outer membrane protein beta-barrel domain
VKASITSCLSILCLATFFAVSSAYAQSAANGFYVGAGLNASASATGKISTPSVGRDRTGQGAKVNAGYQITPKYGVEAGWSGLGSFSETYKTASGATTQKYKVNTTHLAATGRWGVTENLSVVAKAGVGFNKVSGNNLLPVSDNLLGTKTALFSSAGLSYKLSPTTAVTLDYDVAGKRSNKVYAHALTVGLQYNF